MLKPLTITVRFRLDLGVDRETLLRALAFARSSTPKQTLVSLIGDALDDWALANPDRIPQRILDRIGQRRELRRLREAGYGPDPEPTRCGCVRFGLRCHRPVAMDGGLAEASQRCAACAGGCGMIVRRQTDPPGPDVTFAHIAPEQVDSLLKVRSSKT